MRDQLVAELREGAPDEQKVKQLETRFTALNRMICGEQYAEARTDLLEVQVAWEKVKHEINTALSAETLEERRAKLVGLPARREALSKSAKDLRVRIGDPLISVEAPADAEQVIGLLPSGEVKRLAFNADNKRWEARFDIPGYAVDGEYVITVIIVFRDGTRIVLTMRYHVDLTPPTGVGQAWVVTVPERKLRLEVDASEDTARVAALLPWDERIELTPSTQPYRHFGLVRIPPAYQAGPFAVTFVLTDKAHNRTVLTVDGMAN